MLLAHWWMQQVFSPFECFQDTFPQATKNVQGLNTKLTTTTMICHTGTCVRKIPICVSYVPSFSNIWTIKLFLLNSNTTVFCTLSLFSSELSVNHFPSQVFSHLHLLWYYRSFIFSVILSVWNFPSVELLWYYGYHFLSNSILDCPISVFFDIGS